MIPALVAYKAQINSDISTQSAPDSIDPATVGGGFTDLVDIIDPYLEKNILFTAGSSVPSNLDGSNGDVYFQGEPDGTITVWQKISGSWVSGGSFSITGSILVTGNFDANGNFDASSYSINAYPTFQVYQSNESIIATYNSSTKLISGGTPGAFTAIFK